MNPVFDLFVDRTQSLLERWQRFYATEAKNCKTDEKLQLLQDKCLLGVVSEISDPFTQRMIDEVNHRIAE
jgi:hypothetical protein